MPKQTAIDIQMVCCKIPTFQHWLAWNLGEGCHPENITFSTCAIQLRSTVKLTLFFWASFNFKTFYQTQHSSFSVQLCKFIEIIFRRFCWVRGSRSFLSRLFHASGPISHRPQLMFFKTSLIDLQLTFAWSYNGHILSWRYHGTYHGHDFTV